MSAIADNIRVIRERVNAAAERSGRRGSDVTIVAVSKTRPPEDVVLALDAGIRDFGENKVQELTEKIAAVNASSPEAQGINWHMIGHLQRNKVKYIVGDMALIHSVDSLRLAEEIDARAKANGLRQEILIQVNPAGEESKFGIEHAETRTLIAKLLESCPNLKVMGLMCIAPAAADPEASRGHFHCMKALYDECSSGLAGGAEMKYLSMGMTHDFETAIEEGANLVRVGTGIFGERNSGFG
jgi:pyridoxal phosphate enzyme (YggS family)